MHPTKFNGFVLLFEDVIFWYSSRRDVLIDVNSLRES